MRNNLITQSNYSRIYNNVFMSEANNNNYQDINHIIIDGTGHIPFKADIYNNSFRIGGNLGNYGTAGQVVSTSIYVETTQTNNNLDFKNNIFINDRTGGNNGVIHTNIHYANNLSEFKGDYNTYNCAQGNYIKYANNVYNSIASWQSFVVNSYEVNSNSTPVTTVNTSNLELSGASINDIDLIAVPIPYITTDIKNIARNTPYRGAFESTSMPSFCLSSNAQITLTSNVNLACSNTPINLYVAGINTQDPDLQIQWQSSPDAMYFTNINGANGTQFNTSITQDTYYRVIITCSNNSNTITTTPKLITFHNQYISSGITYTNSGTTFNFQIPVASGQTYTYHWDFGDGNNSTLAAPTHTYTVGGPKNVTLTITDLCGTSTYTTIVYIGCNSSPVTPSISINNNNNSNYIYCKGNILNFIANGYYTNIPLGVELQWEKSLDGINFIDIPGANSYSLLDTALNNIYYRVRATCTNTNQVVHSSNRFVTVNYKPSVDSFTIELLNPYNNYYKFTAEGVGNNPTSYAWQLAPGVIVNDISPSHHYPHPGTYAIKLLLQNSCGNTLIEKTLTTTCPKIDTPIATFIDSAQVCLGDPITLRLNDVTNYHEIMYSFQWQESTDGVNYSNIIGANLSTHPTIVSQASYYRCVVMCMNDTVTISTPFNISFYTIPSNLEVLVQKVDNRYYFSLNMNNNWNVHWNFGDNIFSSLPNPQHTYTFNGIYTVETRITWRCAKDTIYTIISPNTSIENSETDSNIHLYPNPTTDVFVIESNTTSNINRIKIIDMFGKTIYIDGKETNLPLSISSKSLNLQTGIYFVELSSQNKTHTFKLIVN